MSPLADFMPAPCSPQMPPSTHSYSSFPTDGFVSLHLSCLTHQNPLPHAHVQLSPGTAQFPPSTMPALKKPEHCQQAAFLLSHIPFCKWGFMHTHKWYNRCHLSQLCPVTDMASANSTQLHDKLPFSY